MTMKRKQIDTNGLHIQYLPVNQAYALMWYGTLLRIFNSRKEADQELGFLLTHDKSNLVDRYEDTINRKDGE